VLGSAGDLRLDPDLLQLFGEKGAGVGDVGLALVALLGDQLFDFGVLARVQGGEGEVLQLPLDRVDPEPVGERRVDLQRLAPSVRMLWRRSASLIRITLTSVAIATIILR
jgi:hypothetical protein